MEKPNTQKSMPSGEINENLESDDALLTEQEPEVVSDNSELETSKLKQRFKNLFRKKGVIEEDDVAEYLYLGSRESRVMVGYRPNPEHPNYEENMKRAKRRGAERLSKPHLESTEEESDTSSEDN